jgi:hypothetical protein
MPFTFHDFTHEIGRLIRFPDLTGPIWRGRFNQVLLYGAVSCCPQMRFLFVAVLLPLIAAMSVLIGVDLRIIESTLLLCM